MSTARNNMLISTSLEKYQNNKEKKMKVKTKQEKDGLDV
jgi:hypothetical protein